MTRVISYVSGIYPYLRNHSLAARRLGRGTITKEELLQIIQADSQQFVAKQKELKLDYISDGQFLWKDYARPFSVSNKNVEETNLEMIRRSDTNTFIRRPKVDNLDDFENINLAEFFPTSVENRILKFYGPYTFANLAITNFKKEEVMTSLSQALGKKLPELIREKNIQFVEIVEPQLSENPQQDLIEVEKTCLSTITNGLDVMTNLSAPFNSVKNIWDKLLDFPVKALTVDMRARDYFNIIPEAEKIVQDHSFLFDHDIQKMLILGCVNGRNGGFTPNKGLETPEWISEVVNKVKEKVDTDLGITFSTDEVILPRILADKKLESIAKAKLLGVAA